MNIKYPPKTVVNYDLYLFDEKVCNFPCLVAVNLSCFLLFSGLLTAINCFNVKWATRVQDIFTTTKIIALVVIILTGLWALIGGETSNIQNPMEGTNTSPGYIALSFYSGLFSYAGW